MIKNLLSNAGRYLGEQDRPDYYISPTRDFTQYTRDCEKKYWNRDIAFDWQQDVADNLRTHLNGLSPDTFSKLALEILPMIQENIQNHIKKIGEKGVPVEENALKALEDCIFFDKDSIKKAQSLLIPLKDIQSQISALEDRIDMLEGDFVDCSEQLRLGFISIGTNVKPIESNEQKAALKERIQILATQIKDYKAELQQYKAKGKADSDQYTATKFNDLQLLKQQILDDLQDSRVLVEGLLKSGIVPTDPIALAYLKDLILKRQLRALKDICNHALVVEQSAIAPLTMGIIHYRRHREIQEALTTFIQDEAKHSATFRRYLAEKLDAKEFVSSKLIKGANRYMWLARFFPGAGMFLAVIVEAIGASSLEFFGKEAYMPDKLFRSICSTISDHDEARHLDLCVAIYNELFRRGTSAERIRNQLALYVILKSVYGDKKEDHRLIQAFRAFGVDSDALYRHLMTRVSEQLARISMYVTPDKLLHIIGR